MTVATCLAADCGDRVIWQPDSLAIPLPGMAETAVIWVAWICVAVLAGAALSRMTPKSTQRTQSTTTNPTTSITNDRSK